MIKEVISCSWPNGKAEDILYHDNEWGSPLHDDDKLFEFIILEGFQAGLSWSTILKKRQNFRDAFDNFNARKIVEYDQNKIDDLMQNAGIIRNRLKILATINNAKIFLHLQKEFGTFDKYIWQFTGEKSIQNNWQTMNDVPAFTSESDAMSKDMKERGFKFVGTTICYAFMQATGMVNDHIVNCFRYLEVQNIKNL